MTPAATVLRLESLEHRWVPAVIVTTGIDLDGDGRPMMSASSVMPARTSFRSDDDGTNLLLDVDKNKDGDFTDPGEFQDQLIAPSRGIHRDRSAAPRWQRSASTMTMSGL